jgi:hypothetical protein
LATHYGRIAANLVKKLSCGTHKDPEREESHCTVTEAGKRSWRERRPIARDRRKWKELVKTYVPDGTMDIITLYNHT